MTTMTTPKNGSIRGGVDSTAAVNVVPTSGGTEGLVLPPSVNRSSCVPGTTSTASRNLSAFRPPSIDTAAEAQGGPQPPVALLSASSLLSAARPSPNALFQTPDRPMSPASRLGAGVTAMSLSPFVSPGSARRKGRRTTTIGYSPASMSSVGAASPVGTPRGRFFSSSVGGGSVGGGGSSVGGSGSASVYSDRFIPSRATSNLSFSVWDEGTPRGSRGRNGEGGSSDISPDPAGGDRDSTDAGGATNSRTPDGSGNGGGGGPGTPHTQPLLNVLLRSELLGENVDPASPPASPGRYAPSGNGGSGGSSGGSGPGGPATPLREGRGGGNNSNNFLRFQSPRQAQHRDVFSENFGPGSVGNVVDAFGLSPIGSNTSRKLMAAAGLCGARGSRKRRIPRVPFKVLDAPALQDDFYLNLVDWSSLNVLAVGLGSCVYLWSACTSKVTKLCDLAQTEDIVTSVSWTQRGAHLAVGTNRGEVQIWDSVKCRRVRTLPGHSARIGTLSWSGPTLASGSRDRQVLLRDVRSARPHTARLGAHKQEVCGLKWSHDEPAYLASGGNDNKLLVWDVRGMTSGPGEMANSSPHHHRNGRGDNQPVHRFAEHGAAVKAIAWSPHQHGLLASGGGTADRCIRFWNTLSGTCLNCVDTGSQVCNLAWSRNCNELISTHGYSLNQIVVWKYPNMSKVATLTGHTYRVLYLSMSPDGSTIVT